jgi:mono/diheme cytochrome c family protein
MKPYLIFTALGLLISSCQSREEMEYEKFLVNGEMMYRQICANCHGVKGEGLRNLYPPLMDNEHLKDINHVVCVIKNGASGSLMLNGQVYDQAMPANPRMYDLDMAQLVTFLNSRFLSSNLKLETGEVKDILDACK